MAKKKKKHGKVEKKKSGPILRFKLGVLLILILLSFAATFGLYMVNATSDPDYWENEILANSQNQPSTENKNSKNKNAVTNPVPASERAEETRMEECAFIGDVSPLTSYYNTRTSLVFTDNVANMSESRMKSISRSVTEAKAIYLWYNLPENAEETENALKNLTAVLQEQHNKPIYLLTAIPSGDLEESRKIDEWNSTLFALADDNGLHYVDISPSLKNNDGTLIYQDEETLYKAIGETILTHIAD